MKSLLIIISLSILSVSCGKDLRKAIGADYNNEINKMNNKINDHEQRLFSLENKVNNLVSDMDSIQYQIESSHESLLNNLLSIQENLQEEIDLTIADIAELKLKENIVEFIDPCGVGSGYNEIILKTSTGKYVAYFESGNKRFLTVLSDGNYVTTDNQACQFTVNNGELTWH